MRRFFVGILALVPVVAMACGDDEDDGAVQAGGAGGSSGSGTLAGGVGGESGAGSAGGGGQGGAGDPGCEYDLKSYDGDTSGLCDAVEVKVCDFERCGDYGAAPTVICSPDGSTCVPANGVCTKNTECGWIDCDVERVDEFCDGLEDLVEEVKQGGGTKRCVRDEDCSPKATCSRRVDDMMVCDPIEWSQGGNGGQGGGE